MHHLTDKRAHAMAFIIPVLEHWLEGEVDQWVLYEGSIQQPITP